MKLRLRKTPLRTRVFGLFKARKYLGRKGGSQTSERLTVTKKGDSHNSHERTVRNYFVKVDFGQFLIV
ncbi:hypothetical protein L596_029907 [Steinernema carpocapsae]|uniref:Uncharacterized protein n=1 Tax=Steinernema carpocapsae TaxID=34508 RepID=A0A4U5LR56_STECR|nr:hypothetical protein L596_029907 [Steinernema carpocapsae]